jgi:hypothetical protein
VATTEGVICCITIKGWFLVLAADPSTWRQSLRRTASSLILVMRWANRSPNRFDPLFVIADVASTLVQGGSVALTGFRLLVLVTRRELRVVMTVLSSWVLKTVILTWRPVGPQSF